VRTCAKACVDSGTWPGIPLCGCCAQIVCQGEQNNAKCKEVRASML